MGKKKRKDLTPDEIVAWAKSVAGMKQKDIATQADVNIRTVQSWLKKVRGFIGDNFDIKDYRTPLYGLYPLAVKSLINNLNNDDVQTTIAVLKGLNILTEKYEHEHKDISQRSSADLVRELFELGIDTTAINEGESELPGTKIPS